MYKISRYGNKHRTINDMNLQTIINNNLFYFVIEMEIGDLSRNLPKIPKPIIKYKFYITGSSESLSNNLFTLDLPSELKRPPIMNGFIFPLEIYNDQCLIWTGHKPAPRIGGGSRQLWKLIDDNWECVTSNSTWIS